VEDLIPNSKLRSLCLRHYFSSVLPSWFLSVYYSFSSFWWRRSFLIRIAVFCSPTTSFCIMSALNFVVSNIEFLCSIGAVSVMIFIPRPPSLDGSERSSRSLSLTTCPPVSVRHVKISSPRPRHTHSVFLRASETLLGTEANALCSLSPSCRKQSPPF